MMQDNKTKIFIDRAEKIHGDKYDYSKVNYLNALQKITIICKIHKDFLQTPHGHLQGYGCRKCVVDRQHITINQFINRAKEIHGNNYDYSKVDLINVETKVIIICNKHNIEFQQTPKSHCSGSGCPFCGKETSDNKKTMTQEEFINKAKATHRNKYDYSKVVYKNSCTKVEIVCKKHGIFKQLSTHHIGGAGCRKCAIESITLAQNKFIERSKEIHENKYDYSKVIYINNTTKITIICPDHGEFQQVPSEHTRGRGCFRCNLCPKCSIWHTLGRVCKICKYVDKKISRKKTKELEVVKFLKTALPDNEFIHNKSIGKDCTEGHLFPDIRFDCGSYQLIVEIDENKHRGSQYECDRQRMYDIIAKCGQFCIFIRYNPDSRESDRDVLLNTVEEYMDLNGGSMDGVFDDYGLKCIYLFY
jgi:hypothetical protein